MTTENISEILKERLAKIEGLRAQNIDLYGERFLPIEPVSSVRENFEEHRKVRIAGRLMSVRGHGKSAFADLRDENARIQVYVKKDVVGDSNYELFSKLDLGDIVGIEG